MKRLLKDAVGISILLFGFNMLYGQKGLSGLELGVNFGTYIYQGDLTPSSFGSYKTPGLGFMIFANKRLSNAFSIRTNLAYAKLKGDDAKYAHPSWRQQRNFNFNARVIELSGLIVWDAFSQSKNIRVRPRLSPYLFGGAGISIVNVKSDWSSFNPEYFAEEPNVQEGLVTDSKHSRLKILPVIPLGMGVKYAVSSRISIHAESSYRFTRSDYLDGFSQAANPSKIDNYYSISIGFTYKFGKNMLDCPVLPK